MTQTATKPAQKRILFILRRYTVNTGITAGDICNVVRSIKMVKGQEVTHEYQVWTRPDGCTTCNCDSRKPCVHMLFVQEAEDERKEQEAELDAKVEAEVAEVLAELDAKPATTEEIAATRDKLLLPNNADQVAYFVQLNRRSDALKPVPTPTVRNVSDSWLLGHRGGTFSGRAS